MTNFFNINKALPLVTACLFIWLSGLVIQPVREFNPAKKSISLNNISFVSNNTDNIPTYFEEISEDSDEDILVTTVPLFTIRSVRFKSNFSKYKKEKNPIPILELFTDIPPPGLV